MKQSGFSLIELMIVVATLTLLAGIAVPAYRGYVNESNVSRAVSEIRQLQMLIAEYYDEYRVYPDTLAQARAEMEDPWGNPYQYLRIAGNDHAVNKRKDHALVPINSDFDLYSKGKDGRSVAPLTAMHSRDDIVRGSNGSFVGLASDY